MHHVENRFWRGGEALTNLNLFMKKQNRHTLLFVDNAPCHPTDIELSNIKLQFFPAITTSTIQPLDRGVIHSFKANYRTSLVKHIIASSSAAQTTSDITITALDAVCWIDSARKSVTESTIQNTFTAVGFKQKQIEHLPDIITSDTINGSSSTFNDLSSMHFGINEVTKVLDGLLLDFVSSVYLSNQSNTSIYLEQKMNYFVNFLQHTLLSDNLAVTLVFEFRFVFLSS